MSSAVVAVAFKFEVVIKKKSIMSGKNIKNRLKHAGTARQMNDIITAQASSNDQA